MRKDIKLRAIMTRSRWRIGFIEPLAEISSCWQNQKCREIKRLISFGMDDSRNLKALLPKILLTALYERLQNKFEPSRGGGDHFGYFCK